MSTPAAECPICGQPLTTFGGEAGVCVACLWATGLRNPARDLPAEVSGWEIPGHDLLAELSRGGMGVVYRAMQHQPRRQVALKMLLPVHCQSPALQDRFRVEAAALAQLEHPGILPLHQFGEVDGIPYFTMKLATGGSLADLLKSPERLPSPRTAASWVESLAETLHHAHQHGVLHRDIKPGNILFDESGQPCLGDFGLAKLADGDSGLTRTTSVMGTPCYLPPEVTWNGSKAATTASDIYSLGAVFYELLAGRPPFVLEGMAAILRQIADEMPDAPSTIVAAVPRDLEVICMTCLAKEPDRRYASADALAEDLKRWRTGAPILARRAGGGERLAMWARRKPALAGLSAALVITAVSGTAGLWFKNKDLQKSLAATRSATALAEKRAQFLLGAFADSLEDLGRVDLLDQAWSSLEDANAGVTSASGDSQGALMSARLFLRWSRVLLAQGKCDEAEARARATLKFLPSLPPAEIPAVERESKTAIAWALADKGQYEAGAEALESVRSVIPWSHPGAAVRSDGETSLARANLIFRQDHGISQLGPDTKVPEALEHARRALAKIREWRTADPDNPEAVFTEIQCLRAEGRARYYLESFAEARPLFIQARDAAESLCAGLNPPSRWRELYADLIGWAGQAASRMGPDKRQEAELGLTGELKAVDEMLAANPTNARLRLRLGDCHWALQVFRESIRDSAQAAVERRKRLDVLASLYKDAPGVREVRLAYCKAAVDQMKALQQSKQKDGLDALGFGAAEAAKSEILRRRRDVKDQRGWQQVVKGLCETWGKAGRPEQALKLLDDSIDFAEKQAAADPASAPWWRWSQASFLRREAELHRGMGNKQLVLARTREALRLRVELLKAKWELETIAGEVPYGYVLIGEALDSEKRWEEALDSAEEALQCWRDYSQEIGGLDDWLKALSRACRSATESGVPELKTRGLSLARSTVRAMTSAVTAPRRALGEEAKKNWAALQALTAAAPPEPPKSSLLPSSLRIQNRNPGFPRIPVPVGEHPAPALQMSLLPAQVFDSPFPGSLRESGQQCGIILQLPGITPVVLRSVTQEPPDAVGHQLTEMMAAAAGHKGHHAAEHALHHGAAPAFPELWTKVVNHDIQGIQEGHHGHAAGGHQIPAGIEGMVRPASGHLLTPAEHAEPGGLRQVQPLVAEWKIPWKFIGIRPGDASHREGELPFLWQTALPEGKGGGIDVVSSGDPRHFPASGTAGQSAPPLMVRRQKGVGGKGKGAGRRAGHAGGRPAVAGLQCLALDRGDIKHLLHQPVAHSPQFAVKVPHHFTAPDDPQAAPDTAAQHPAGEKPAIAQGDGPAFRPIGNLLRQTPLHPESPQVIQPLRILKVTGVVRHHRDVILSGQEAESVDKLGVRSADMGRPVEPV
ncbi:MAG: hypothetical protein JWM59_3312 [Verrucomicrobiales bacterium]|nr:hypothetical protein [Verrucomicrobiales bacterium]